MAEDDEDEINLLKNSPIDVSGGPIGDEAFMDHRLAADLEETAAVLAQAPLTAPPPFSASDVVVVIEPNPIPIETRSHAVADELIEIIHLEAAPEWMDSQINVRDRDGVLSIEVVVLRRVEPLWAVIDVLGEPLGTTFVVDAIDQTTRTAYLPAAVVRGGDVRFVLGPPR